jgi:hypothetical protein
MTRDELRTELAQRLGDSSNAIWTAAELARYIQQGYDDLTLKTGCLLGMAILPDYPARFTFTQEWERDLVPTGQYAIGPASFTAMFERDFVSNSRGPANHNYPWEYDSDFVDTFLGVAVEDLPDDLYQIERATWNGERISPLRSSDVEFDDSRYEIDGGDVRGYIQDKDGVNVLRKWKVPASTYTTYDFDTDSDDGFGIIRDFDGIIDDLTPAGEWGDVVDADGIEVLESWGILGPIYSDTHAVRMEYRRRGVELSDDQQEFEIASRYVTYVRNFAQARALEREGPGQEKELAAFYQSRYEAGIARMLKRQQAMAYQKATVMGGTPRRGQAPPRARLPYNFGQVVRY